MAPPSYSDLGKQAKGVFSSGYNWGFFKLSGKSKTEKGVEFKASLNNNRETGKVAGALETTYKWTEYGLTFTEKWNTDNVLSTEIKIEDQLADGHELALSTSFDPQTGKKAGSVSTSYKHDLLALDGEVGFGAGGTSVEASTVFGFEGFLAGCQMAFDPSKSKLTNSNFGFGYLDSDFSISAFVNNNLDEEEGGQEFTASVHHKVSSDLDAAVSLAWQSGGGTASFALGGLGGALDAELMLDWQPDRASPLLFALGGRCMLDEDTSISMMFNRGGRVGVGFTQKVCKGVHITMSSLIDGSAINSGGHTLGLGLDFEAGYEENLEEAK